MTWPDGREGEMKFVGIARDLHTGADGSSRVVAYDVMNAQVAWDRTIKAISCEPAHPRIGELAGYRGGGHLRQVLNKTVPDIWADGRPLYLLLDDLSGTSLIAGWAWSRWTDSWMRPPAADGEEPVRRIMTNICSGFREGSTALKADGTSETTQNATAVPPLQHPDDLEGWHPLEVYENVVSMRRARRIDVWLEDGVVQIESTFQDSASVPQGGRVAIHEYALRATADAKMKTLLSVRADPRTLPYRECPMAANNVSRMEGSPLADLRLRVLSELRGTAGCTHLNDALRALAEVPTLVNELRAVPA